MFTKYWRSYPWPLQLLLFVLLMFVILAFGSLAIQRLIPVLYGIKASEMMANLHPGCDPKYINAFHFSQIAGTAFTFLLPCSIFAYLTHPKPAGYLGLRRPGKAVQWPLVAIAMIGFLVCSLFLEGVLKNHITLSKDLLVMQKENEERMQALLGMNSIKGFLLTFFSVALLTPFAEELMFRGTLMRFAFKSTKRLNFSVLITAVLFTLSHYDPYGWTFIFIAGVLLALFYYLTGSLWCSILAHALYNGIQVIVAYYQQHTHHQLQINTWHAVAGAAVFAVSFYLLIKNRTPLAPNWTDDYLGEQKPADN